MYPRAVTTMAELAKERVAFYTDFYKDCPSFPTVEDIPVLRPHHLADWNSSHELKYFEPLDDPSQYMQVNTSGSVRGICIPVMYNYAELPQCFMALFNESIFNTLGNVRFVMPDEFEIGKFFRKTTTETTLIDNIADTTILRPASAQAEDYLGQELAIAEGECVVVMGAPHWLAWLATVGLLTENHYVIQRPKPGTALLPMPEWVKQFNLFTTAEIGMVGWHTSFACSIKDYHMTNNKSLFVEIVNGELVATYWRKAFNFIRYCTEDLGEIYEGTCSCGYTGQFYKHFGRAS